MAPWKEMPTVYMRTEETTYGTVKNPAVRCSPITDRRHSSLVHYRNCHPHGPDLCAPDDRDATDGQTSGSTNESFRDRCRRHLGRGGGRADADPGTRNSRPHRPSGD